MMGFPTHCVADGLTLPGAVYTYLYINSMCRWQTTARRLGLAVLQHISDDGLFDAHGDNAIIAATMRRMFVLEVHGHWAASI